jgi:hypothetical protein
MCTVFVGYLRRVMTAHTSRANRRPEGGEYSIGIYCARLGPTMASVTDTT